ncbi:MAG: hypothetical protein L0K01_01740, partial [Brachybacterium sp.]|nr:hypothetical protein [Brachybacterium sp.]
TDGRDGDLPTVRVDQIVLHGREHLRPRLEGLSDEEYFFDPSADGYAWTLPPRTPAGPPPPPAGPMPASPPPARSAARPRRPGPAVPAACPPG